MVSRNYFGGRMAQTCAQAQAWVKENYELHEAGVVAKSVIYSNYENFCRDNGRPVMETSIFGRVVKQVFPEVQIRRLGGRDNLKYYYCGIQAQPNSPHVSDNQNTIKPKRRQRKRPSVTDKAEAQTCLRWLLSNYAYDGVSSVSVSELYDHYVRDIWTSVLSSQDFGLVVTDGLSKLSKRRISSKMLYQGCFLGFKRLSEPLDPSNMSGEMFSQSMSVPAGTPSGSLIDYREGSNTPDDDDFCASPESEEGSDGLLDVKDDQALQFDDEPVDYSLSGLRVKSDVMDSVMKGGKMSGDDSISSYTSPTPEGPSSTMMESPTPSPSPPQKATRPKIYKPRFHINYQEDMWTEPSDQDSCYPFSSVLGDEVLKEWLNSHLESCTGWGVNRDQLYALYQQDCHRKSTEVFPLAHFDKVVLGLYPGTATRMRSQGVTLYQGVNINYSSPLKHQVYEINEPMYEPMATQWGCMDRPMDLSSPTPEMNDSPINIADDDFEDSSAMDQYREQLDEDDEVSIPEVLKDGKYYLKTWLQENFEPVPEACVLKADAYKYYEHFAQTRNQSPFEMNVFGKIVRQVFPDVSIRRLGGRQKPQYHYCGIAAKPTSKLFSIMGGKDPAQRSRKKEISTDSAITESALQWLESSFEPDRKGFIMKADVYDRYKYHCSSLGIQPHNLNYFGKLVKHTFPDIEVRKCGGRVEPTWHYQGLRLKDHSFSSPLHHPIPHHDSSNPISVPGGSSAPMSSIYSGSPLLVPSMGSFPHDPRQSPRYLSHPSDGYARSPELSRAFKETLRTRGAMEASGRLVHSPDVAPEFFSRSPEGGSSAQISRSPASSSSSSYHLLPQCDSSNSSAPSSFSQGQDVSPHHPLLSSSMQQLVPGHTPPGESLLQKKLRHQHLSPDAFGGNSFSGRS